MEELIKEIKEDLARLNRKIDHARYTYGLNIDVFNSNHENPILLIKITKEL